MKIAVVGSGVAGLGAVWVRVDENLVDVSSSLSVYLSITGLKALNEYSEHEVHLFEADERPGGHANTVEYTSPSTGLKTKVDTYDDYLPSRHFTHLRDSESTYCWLNCTLAHRLADLHRLWMDEHACSCLPCYNPQWFCESFFPDLSPAGVDNEPY